MHSWAIRIPSPSDANDKSLSVIAHLSSMVIAYSQHVSHGLQPIMTEAERRDKARLRSKKWRRAHGIMPRRKAARPWLALGISRSTPTTGAAPNPASKRRRPPRRQRGRRR